MTPGELCRRLAALARRRRLERDLRDEMALHVDLRAAREVERGATPDEAARRARRAFGNEVRYREDVRDAWEGGVMGARSFEWLIQDVRYSLRMMRRNPVVTIAVTVSLALGLGANTAIFSVVDALLVRTLPVATPEQLVLLARQSPTFTNQTVSYPLYRDLETQNATAFDGLFATSGVSLVRATSGTSGDTAGIEVRQVFVTGTYFPGLGIRPAIGRLFTPDDDRTVGGHSVAVIGHSYWQRAFAGEASVLGRIVRINDVAYTVIGATPPGFFGVEVGNPPDVYLPTAMQTPATLLNRNGAWLRPIGRLRRGVSEAQAIERLNVTLRQHLLDAAAPARPGQPPAAMDQTIQMVPASRGLSPLRAQMSRPLLILMAMVGIVLVIACANVANLVLARATARRSEIATRLAVGASQRRLVRQLTTESLVLVGGAAVLGMLAAPLVTRALVALLFPQRGATDLEFRLDSHVLLFTGAVALIAGVACGLVPALRATRTDPSASLKASAGTPRASGAALRAGKVLVVAQMALAVVLVMGASLLLQTFQRLHALDTGFVRDRAVLARVRVGATGPKDAARQAAYARLLDRARALPGVRAAGLTTENVLSGGTRLDAVFTRGMVMPKRMADLPLSRVLQVSPGFFEAMGMQIRRGRGFTDQDTATTARVAIINEALARQHFPSRDPIGQRFGFDGPKTADQLEIVGVVNDVTYGNLRSERPSMFFLPLWQAADVPGALTLVVHTQQNPASLLTAVPRMVSEAGQGLDVAAIATQDQYVADALRQERALAHLSSLFGLMALLLASVGIFAVISYTVTRRTSEFGIRLALGATRGDVMRIVVGETLRLVVLAVIIGVPVAVASSRYIATLLFGLTPMDPLSIGASLAVVAAMALLAGFIPAHRASRLDPVRALRAE